MSEERYKIFSINPDDKNTQMDVIFIHGLGGDKYSTWQNSNNESWQKWLAKDYNVSVYSIAYGANMTNWDEDDMKLDETADFFLSSLKSEGIGDKPYMFVVHSLGGLLVKNILLKAQNSKDYKYLLDMCKSIVFFAVPHSGSGWATLLNYGKVLLRSSNLLESLSKNTQDLHNLTTNFNQLIINNKIETYVFYETKKVKIEKIIGFKSIVVVSRESATIVHSTNQVIPLPKDHITICKIDDRDDDLYKHKIKSIMNKTIEINQVSTQKESQSDEQNNSSTTTSIHYGSGDIITGDKVTHNNNSVSIGGSNSGSIVIGNNNKVNKNGK